MGRKKYRYCQEGKRWYLSCPYNVGPHWVMSERKAREVLACIARSDRKFPFDCPRSEREIERGKKYAGK